jgi:RNA polymerase sporulation-specific sigma factor
MAKYRVEISGISTSKLKVLTNEEMVELFKKYQNKDKFAKEDLINGNLKLVLSVIKGYSNRTDNMDDLFQVGCVGLIKAIDNFDLSHEVKFSTYAVPMILGEVKRYLRDNTGLRVTRSLKDTAYKGLKIKEELTNKLNREPTTYEIAKELNLTEYEVTQAFEAMRDVISMSEPIYNESGDTIYLSEQIKDNKEKLELDTLIMLKEAMKSLKEKERFIIYKRYFEGITQMELSESIGISQAQISRIEKNSLETMKKLIR